MKAISGPRGVVMLAVIVLAACSPASEARVARSTLARVSDPGVPAGVLLSLTASNNGFALDLYGALREQSGNLVFSPYSVSSALAMTYAGARAQTESQMAAVLHLDLPQDQLHPAFNQLDLSLADAGRPASAEEQPLQLRIANAMWIDKTLHLLDEYLDVIARSYGAGIHLADFIAAVEPARREINAWVSEQTERRIEDLIPQGALDESTRMVLVNAIYFRGDWQDPFDASNTKEAAFHLLNNQDVRVQMMHAHLPGALYAVDQGYQVVELPYQGGTAAMDIIVPDEANFEAFEAALDSERLTDVLGKLQMASLQLGLPKFSFGASFDLGEELTALGMKDAFDPYRADFAGMTGGRDLFISKALHQAFVAVDEKGTEAAAATAIIIAPTSIMLPDVALIVDRPFIFVIRDLDTQQILFLGRVIDPTT